MARRKNYPHLCSFMVLLFGDISYLDDREQRFGDAGISGDGAGYALALCARLARRRVLLIKASTAAHQARQRKRGYRSLPLAVLFCYRGYLPVRC